MRRVRKGEMVGGVCTGMAKYFGWGLDTVRWIFIITWLLGFSSMLVYILFWIFVEYEK